MKHQQRGIGLVEVMVALLLLAVAVLGFSAMQMQAVNATDESLIRSRALTIMRGGAEIMRANSGGIAAFKDAMSGTSTSVTVDGVAITKDSCISYTSTPTTCSIKQLAARDALVLKDYASNNDINLAVVICPGTQSNQERQCMIASWGDTKAIMNDSDADACAKSNGTYKRGARCFIMEAY